MKKECENIKTFDVPELKQTVRWCSEVFKRTGVKYLADIKDCEKCDENYLISFCQKIKARQSPAPPPLPNKTDEPYKELTVTELAENFASAMTRFAKSGFKLIDKKKYIERQVCCTTCGSQKRCRYCGCFINAKARLASEAKCPDKTTYPRLHSYPPRNYWGVCDVKTTIIIPSRNESSVNLTRTIENIFETATGLIEIIVVLDDYNVATTDILDNFVKFYKNLKVIKFEKPQGRRKAINTAAIQAMGTYLFIIDAHCKMSEGWDTKMKCACGERDLVFGKTKHLDNQFNEMPGEYHFVYISGEMRDVWWYGRQPKSLIEPSMAFTGCGWMIRKDYYLALGGMDESLGEYGHNGVEMSLKIQCDDEIPGRILLRDDVICSHLFSTNTNSKLYQANYMSQPEFKRKMFEKYKWRITPLVGKFSPPEWIDDWREHNRIPPTIISCTDNSITNQMKDFCFDFLKGTYPGANIIRLTTPPTMPRCALTYYKLLLQAMESTDAEFVYEAEHDALYPREPFEFIPPRKEIIYYYSNTVCLTKQGWLWWEKDRRPYMMIGYRPLLIAALKVRITAVEAGWTPKMFEPGFFDPATKFQAELFKNDIPIVDIRHGHNYTGERTGDEYLEEIPYWGHYKILWKRLGVDL